MNRYERYKDSGIPWLGEVPEHWEIKHINQIFKIHNGATPKTSEPDYWGDEIAWFTPKDLGDNKNKEIAASLKMITKEGYENCGVSLAPAKSIALSKRAPIGHLAITLLPAVVNQGCFLLEVLSPNDVNYLYYWLYANKSTLNSFGQGSTFMELPREKFAMLKISIPPEKEQTAIAHYLDTKLGEIDALIDKQQTLIEKLAEQRTAVITHAVTKGLNPAAPMKKSGVEWLGDIPAYWDEGKLKNICTAFGRIGFRGYSTADLVNEGEGPITLSPSNIKNTNMDYEKCTYLSWEKYLESPEIMLHKNDIVIVKTGSSYGKVGFIDDLPTEATINPQLLVIKRININSKYLFYILLSEIFQFQINQNVIGSTIPTISESKILNFNTPYPSDINEQITIADYLDQETAKIDRLCETVNQTIGRLKEYRTALITQAVTGKIKVTDE